MFAIGQERHGRAGRDIGIKERVGGGFGEGGAQGAGTKDGVLAGGFARDGGEEARVDRQEAVARGGIGGGDDIGDGGGGADFRHGGAQGGVEVGLAIQAGGDSGGGVWHGVVLGVVPGHQTMGGRGVQSGFGRVWAVIFFPCAVLSGAGGGSYLPPKRQNRGARDDQPF